MNFAVQIQSYNRYNKLIDLIEQINSQERVPIIVVDDRSTDIRYSELSKKYDNVSVVRTSKNGGKEKYWRTVSLGLSRSKTIKWDWLVFLADDFSICDDFFTQLRDNCKNSNAVINFFFTGQEAMWEYKGYVDGAFCAHRNLWNDLQFKINKIHPIRWRNNPNLSSGVWWDVTKRLNRKGYNVVFTDKKLCDHLGNETSKMHPKLRINNPIW